MESYILFKTTFSLLIVILLIFIVVKILQKLVDKSGDIGKSMADKDMRINEVLYIDQATRIIDISRGKFTRYVILIGKNNEQLIEIYNHKK